MNAAEIVKALDGTNAAARFFGVRPPSVTEWCKNGVIPDDRLIRKAALLERRLPGMFSRREQWPDTHHEIWPELGTPACAAAANADDGQRELDLVDRRSEHRPIDFPDRRASGASRGDHAGD